MLFVAPAALVRLEEIGSRLAERRGRFRIRLVPLGDRIDTRIDQGAPFGGLFARRLERYAPLAPRT
jgi:hypothetical protein